MPFDEIQLKIDNLQIEIARLRADKAMLLEALVRLCDPERDEYIASDVWERAAAAIAKATGGTAGKEGDAPTSSTTGSRYAKAPNGTETK